MPIVRVDRKDLERAGNVRLGQPDSLACEADEGDGMINCSGLHRKIHPGNQAVDARDGGTVGGQEVDDEPLFPRLLPHCYSD